MSSKKLTQAVVDHVYQMASNVIDLETVYNDCVREGGDKNGQEWQTYETACMKFIDFLKENFRSESGFLRHIHSEVVPLLNTYRENPKVTIFKPDWRVDEKDSDVNKATKISHLFFEEFGKIHTRLFPDTENEPSIQPFLPIQFLH